MRLSYEKELPEGYREACVIDAKSKKFTVVMNLIAVALIVPFPLIGFLVIKPFDGDIEVPFSHLLVFFGAMILYIIAHELVHGIAYKCLTGQKLSFGMTATVAYCGVPNIYVYRRTAMIALLAPFLTFIPVFLVPTFLLTSACDRFFALILLGIHVSGCVGDLYDTILYLFRFRDPTTLMRDTGPVQTFYRKIKS